MGHNLKHYGFRSFSGRFVALSVCRMRLLSFADNAINYATARKNRNDVIGFFPEMSNKQCQAKFLNYALIPCLDQEI